METEAKPFPRQLAGNWIWSGAARTWTGRSTGNSFTCFTRTPASAYTFTHIFFYTMRMVCQVEDRFVMSKISVYFIMQRKAGWKLTVNRIQWEGKKGSHSDQVNPTDKEHRNWKLKSQKKSQYYRNSRKENNSEARVEGVLGREKLVNWAVFTFRGEGGRAPGNTSSYLSSSQKSNVQY